MPADLPRIRNQALALPPVQRAALADVLLESLESTDPSLDDLWIEEAESRLAAFHRGEMEAIPAEDVFRANATP